MWWALDVHYKDEECMVAGVGFSDFTTAWGSEAVLTIPGPPEPYEPGQFYRRELPLLQRFLAGRDVAGVVVDGFVWLAEDRPGLGAHLRSAIPGIDVIGVAKTGFRGSEGVALPVLRGESTKPLWVTAEGVGVAQAAGWVQGMHGEFRLPTLLKRVDALCRNG